MSSHYSGGTAATRLCAWIQRRPAAATELQLLSCFSGQDEVLQTWSASDLEHYAASPLELAQQCIAASQDEADATETALRTALRWRDSAANELQRTAWTQRARREEQRPAAGDIDDASKNSLLAQVLRHKEQDSRTNAAIVASALASHQAVIAQLLEDTRTLRAENTALRAQLAELAGVQPSAATDDPVQQARAVALDKLTDAAVSLLLPAGVDVIKRLVSSDESKESNGKPPPPKPKPNGKPARA